MLRAVIISPDPEIVSRLEQRMADVGRIAPVRTIRDYPSSEELERVLRAHVPHLIFLGLASMDKALAVVRAAEEKLPGVPIVACGQACDQHTLLELMRAGVREFLPVPCQTQALFALAERLEERLEKNPLVFDTTDLVFSFLPSKAGVGASTVAVSTAVALSKVPDTKVLLADFDMSSGLVAFMLKLGNPFSVIDAAERATELDENIWPQLVSQIGSLDVLACGKLNPEFRLEYAQLHYLVDFARRLYKVICIDLSGNLEKYALELMKESKRIFLVCTPEIPSLHLARERLSYLRSLDMSDRVCVLLNRVSRRSIMTQAQVEEVLGMATYATFPNDYQGVHSALNEGRGVDSRSELGKQFTALADRMLSGDRENDSYTSSRRFVEYFSIIPARYSLFPRGK